MFSEFSHSVNISCPMYTVHNIVLKKDSGMSFYSYNETGKTCYSPALILHFRT